MGDRVGYERQLSSPTVALRSISPPLTQMPYHNSDERDRRHRASEVPEIGRSPTGDLAGDIELLMFDREIHPRQGHGKGQQAVTSNTKAQHALISGSAIRVRAAGGGTPIHCRTERPDEKLSNLTMRRRHP